MILSKTRHIEKNLAEATNYDEWREAAKAHDIASGVHQWKTSDNSRHFDYRSIRQRLTNLSHLRDTKDSAGLLFALNEGIHGNMDGMGNIRLYQKAQFGTKKLIEDYVDVIVSSLKYLARTDTTDVSFEDKLDFFRRAQHCYGRSAFLMSGSGNFLYFHLGAVKALWQEGIMPSIISGSSGGSVIGAIICTHSDEDVEKYFDLDYMQGLLSDVETEETTPHGRRAFLRVVKVKTAISKIIPDLTFQEAFDLTGRHLNVSIAPAEQHQKSRLLNAIASPNVCIREAVLASCAVPGIYPPVTLMAKDKSGKRQPYLPSRKWVDGSMTNDLPAKRLARLYGVNHYIVSQANPLVSAFANNLATQHPAIAAVTKASSATIKAWLNANATIMRKPLSMFPRVNSATNMALSLINQNYSGDINIIRPNMFWAPHKLLGDLPKEDMEKLIRMGRKTSWPKLEMIRTQTRISKVLGQIITNYEEELVQDYHLAAAAE